MVTKTPKVSEVIALPRQQLHHSHEYKQVVIRMIKVLIPFDRLETMIK
ncbi:hypothetical protein [Salinivibrio kushneri]|nr:hypothetical protein [Salinivibrio kushneri]